MPLSTPRSSERKLRGPGAKAVWIAALLLLGLLLSAAPASFADSAHPLEPPDRLSPRGTLETFSRSLDTAWERLSRKDPSFEEPLRITVGCLDVSAFPPEVADDLATETALQLKDVLDRIELPPVSQIPGPAEVAEQDLQKWAIPHTEIVLVRIAEGERTGEFLFSTGTVERAPEFYERVKHLPYQPGKQGGHLDEIRSGALSPVLGPLAARLPSWAQTQISGQMVWQWAVVLAALALSVVLAVVAFRWGRRWSAWEERAKGLRRFGPLLFPLTVIATAVFMKELLDQLIRLAGYPFYLGTLLLTLIIDLAIAWLIAVLLILVGELVIRNTRAGERPLNAQLVRLSFRIFTLVAVGGYLLTAADRLGLPVPALVAGLGVGGLAVALATQGTLENLIGGLILYADQPVRVGDFFRFGDKMGIVEDIGLRSARIRTPDRTVVAIPNAELVKMPLENFGPRDRIRLMTLLRLRMETTADQLRFLLTRLWQMLEGHPRLIRDTCSARLVDLAEYSLDVEVGAYASTTDWTEFLAIRQDVFLQVMALVDEAGTRLAVPARLELEAPAPGLDETRAGAAETQARRWREEGNPLVPEYPEAEPGTEGGDPR